MRLFSNALRLFSKVLSGLGVAFEIWETWDLHQKNKKLDESKTELSKYINDYKAHLLSFVNDEESYIKNFAPNFESTLKSREDLSEEVAEFIDKAEKIKEWYNKANFITTVEFEEVG